MAKANKVEVNGETLIDLSTDTVTEETLDEGITAHDAAGNPIMGKRSTANVQYVPQTLTPEQQAQARENIGVVDILTVTEQRNFIDWDGVTTDGEQYDQAYRVTTYAPNLRDANEADVSGTLVLKSLDGALTHLVSFPSNNVMFDVSSTELTVYFKATGTLALYIKSYSYGTSTDASDGVYLGKGYMPFDVTENDHTWQDTREGYVASVIINGLTISENEVISPAVLPGDIVRAVRTDTPDLILVTDGKGGAKWVTKGELGAEEELPPDSEIVVEPGEPGWTYVPNLSAEGYLGFTPKQFGANEGPAEIPPVNIRGPQGPAGPAYELTEEDKAEIVEAVKSEPLFSTDTTLKLENGVLKVNTATSVAPGNAKPVTSGAVYDLASSVWNRLNSHITNSDSKFANLESEIEAASKEPVSWVKITGKPFEGKATDIVTWDGSESVAEYGFEGDNGVYWRITPNAFANVSLETVGRITYYRTDRETAETYEIDGSSAAMQLIGSQSFRVRAGSRGDAYLLNEPEDHLYNDIPNGVYFLVTEDSYVQSVQLDGCEIAFGDVLKRDALPDSTVVVPDGTAADMVPVSDGNGGVVWENKEEFRGLQGLPGKDGSDYILTSKDKAEIAETVKDKVPLVKTAEQPVFVDTIEECTDTEKIYVLPDGYMYAYGERVIPGGSYTNLFPTSIDTDGNIYNGTGYKRGVTYDWVSDAVGYGEITSAEAWSLSTGLIPFVPGDVIRLRDIFWNNNGTQKVIFYNESMQGITSASGKYFVGELDTENKIITFDTNSCYTGSANITNARYIRFCPQWWDPAAANAYDYTKGVITVNEEINDADVVVIDWTNTGIPYQPADWEDRVIALEDNAAELNERIDELEKNGTKSLFDYTGYNLPILYLEGDVTAMTKDNAVDLSYVYGSLSGTAAVKWQGSSSLSYPKKNYTIKFDNAFEAFEGWGEQKKYCLKANFIDHSHARNLFCASLWGDIVKTRVGTDDKRYPLPNGGAVDGFPCVFVLNGEFHGLYTWNIPKDGWMLGMGSGTNECILCANGSSQPAADSFKALETSLGTAFDVEYITDENNTDWALTSLNRMLSAVINSDGTDLDTTVAQYLDWDSVIDHYIQTVLTGAHDCTYKNYLLSTYDGVKWYITAYDMDSTFGLHWNGKSFMPANYDPTFAGYATLHKAMELVKTYKKAELKERYKTLRRGILSETKVANKLFNYMAGIPSQVLDEDARKWPTIPSTSVSNISQILEWYRLRVIAIDNEVEAL